MVFQSTELFEFQHGDFVFSVEGSNSCRNCILVYRQSRLYLKINELYLEIYVYSYIYVYIYMHVLAITKWRGYEFERNQEGIYGGIGGRNEVTIMVSKIKENIEFTGYKSMFINVEIQ